MHLAYAISAYQHKRKKTVEQYQPNALTWLQRLLFASSLLLYALDGVSKVLHWWCAVLSRVVICATTALLRYPKRMLIEPQGALVNRTRWPIGSPFAEASVARIRSSLRDVVEAISAHTDDRIK